MLDKIRSYMALMSRKHYYGLHLATYRRPWGQCFSDTFFNPLGRGPEYDFCRPVDVAVRSLQQAHCCKQIRSENDHIDLA